MSCIEELSRQYEKFISSKQEALRLEIALRGYMTLAEVCDTAELTDRIRETYITYLKRRVRPALQKIAAEGGVSILSQMFKDHILDKQNMPGLLKQDFVLNAPALWITLLQLQNMPGGKTADPDPGEMHRQIDDRQGDGNTEKNSIYYHEDMQMRARSVLMRARVNLYELYPFLDAAVAALSFKITTIKGFFGTDGSCLIYEPEYICEMGARDPAYVTGLYLHTILHCLFQSWDRLTENEGAADEDVVKIISKEIIRNPAAARYLRFSEDYPDDHSLWPKVEDAEERNRLGREWKMLLKYAGSGNGSKGAALLGIGSEAGKSEETVEDLKKGKYDYRTFLKSFAVRREETELDQESFDYIYYTLGMEHCDQTPLIEPLEYKEGHKLEELVIAIDTSGSCDAEMVRRFLEESYCILCEKENFFRTMKVYIIQCDCTVQDVALIRSEEDWKTYCKNLKIYGRSGTNFKPVFVYVDKLLEQGELKNLKGLIYFTDGNGTFPTWEPPYQTAFVFVKKDMGQEKLPPWALQLQI